MNRGRVVFAVIAVVITVAAAAGPMWWWAIRSMNGDIGTAWFLTDCTFAVAAWLACWWAWKGRKTDG